MTFHLFQIKNFVCQLGCVRFVNVNDIAIVICDCTGSKAGGVPGILTVLTNNFNFQSNEKKKKNSREDGVFYDDFFIQVFSSNEWSYFNLFNILLFSKCTSIK